MMAVNTSDLKSLCESFFLKQGPGICVRSLIADSSSYFTIETLQGEIDSEEEDMEEDDVAFNRECIEAIQSNDFSLNYLAIVVEEGSDGSIIGIPRD